MLHADIAAPGADQFVQRIIGAGGAEFLAVALAEAADRRVVEQNLADRAQYRFLLGAGRALGQRVKAADALDRVAEKIETQWLCGAGRIEIDDAAAHRELAGLAHRVGAEIAVVAKEALQPVAADLARWPQDQHPAFEQPPRRHALDQRIDRRQHDQRPLRPGCRPLVSLPRRPGRVRVGACRDCAAGCCAGALASRVRVSMRRLTSSLLGDTRS